MVNVIGLGYIGLPTALMLASHGVEVVGTDYNKQLVDTLQHGEATFKEEGLDQLLDAAIKGGIRFTTDYEHTDMYIVTVPTPYDEFSKKVDASYVVAAVKQVLSVCKPGAVVVIESTVSPGTIDTHIRPLLQQCPEAVRGTLQLVHAPERILPGNMIYEMENNNRTIGADDASVAERVKTLYASFCKGEIVTTDIRTAEMTKVIENTYRAINIAFANELARICRHAGMDVYETIKICNKHPRVNIMNPGPGVGGHCISVDPWFIVGDYPQLAQMIGASLDVNASQPAYVLHRIRQIMAERGIADTKRVGLYGITYKENVDDYRDSPTLQLLEMQRNALAAPLQCYDPMLEDKIITDSQHRCFDDFLNAVDLVVIMVKHNHIKQNWAKLQGKAILDCHNICPLENVYKL